MLYTIRLKLIFKFCLTLLLLSITGSHYCFAYTSHELIKSENYIVIIKNNKGERVENAWVTISLTDKSEQGHFTEPPLYIEFTHQENGRYTARISSNQLQGKIISLSVYTEHHEYFTVEMDQLNQELRVELQFNDHSSTESNLEANHYDNYGLTATDNLQSPGVQIQAVVKSNLGHPIINANLQLVISDSPFYSGTIRQNREIGLTGIGNGTYQTTESVFLDQTHQLELSVYAPDHEPTIQQIPNHQTSVNVQLYHNNYYSRCNDDLGQNSSSFIPWRNNPWEDCSVDPDRLIEVFGIIEKNILNGNRAHLIDSRKPSIHKYAPEISNDFSNYVPRHRAYTTAIEGLLKAAALAKASVAKTELSEWIELELNANHQISNSQLILKGGQIITGFSETFSELSTAMEIAGYAFEVSRANREGYLDGVLMYIAYKSSANEILDRLDLLANRSWMRDDEAFQNSLKDIRDKYERNKDREVQEVVRAIRANRIGETVSDIVFGIALKNALTAAGTSVYAIAAGHAAPAILAGAFQVVAAAAIYDFIRSVEKTGEQRALLSAITQIDRTLFSVPDYYSPAIIEGLSDNQKLDLMMRLQLGIIFNETRAALYSGEFKTWIGYQFQYSEMGSRNAEQAYELKMAEVSKEKADLAEAMIIDLIVYLNSKDKSKPGRDLTGSKNKVLWYEGSDLKINHHFINNSNRSIKSIVAYLSTIAGSSCKRDNRNSNNIICELSKSVGISVQCSNVHLNFIRANFFNYDDLDLRYCYKTPWTATVQTIFSELFIEENGAFVEAYGKFSSSNVRELRSSEWDFKYRFDVSNEKVTYLGKNNFDPDEEANGSIHYKSTENNIKYNYNLTLKGSIMTEIGSYDIIGEENGIIKLNVSGAGADLRFETSFEDYNGHSSVIGPFVNERTPLDNRSHQRVSTKLNKFGISDNKYEVSNLHIYVLPLPDVGLHTKSQEKYSWSDNFNSSFTQFGNLAISSVLNMDYEFVGNETFAGQECYKFLINGKVRGQIANQIMENNTTIDVVGQYYIDSNEFLIVGYDIQLDLSSDQNLNTTANLSVKLKD